jgi:HAD superfamily hydrolase (TIGR01509 family)
MGHRGDFARQNGDSMGIYWPSRRKPTYNPKALVFDMDGVLIDSEALHKSTKRQALRSAGIEVDETVFSRYIGCSDRVMITDVAKIHGCSEDGIEAILAEKDRLYALGQRDLKPVPGAIDFVHWAYQKYRLAVATSATAQNRKCALASLRLTSFFEVAIDSSSIVHPKPSPEVFEKAIAQMEMAPSDCWIIEDALNGVAAAKEVPCFTVALTTSFGESDLLRAGADVVADQFSGIQTLLREASA